MRKSQEEIEQQWFPICKCGNLIKVTKDDGTVSFFIVTSEPTFKKFVALHRGIELKGVWVSRPLCVYEDKLLDCRRGYETTIVCRDDDTLELSNLDEMVDVYKQRYADDVNRLVEKIKVCRKTAAGLKNATRTLRDDVTKMYFDALKLPTSKEL
jgi:hypothetical protein